jgi:hypothetical protein
MAVLNEIELKNVDYFITLYTQRCEFFLSKQHDIDGNKWESHYERELTKLNLLKQLKNI